MLGSLKRELARAPQGGRLPWFFLVIGCIELALGVYDRLLVEGSSASDNPFSNGTWVLALGAMFVLWGASELRIWSRRSLAAVLRVGYWLATVALCALVVVALVP